MGRSEERHWETKEDFRCVPLSWVWAKSERGRGTGHGARAFGGFSRSRDSIIWLGTFGRNFRCVHYRRYVLYSTVV